MGMHRFKALMDAMPQIAHAVNEFPQHLQATVYTALVEAVNTDIDAAKTHDEDSLQRPDDSALSYAPRSSPQWEQRTSRNPVATVGDSDEK